MRRYQHVQFDQLEIDSVKIDDAELKEDT